MKTSLIRSLVLLGLSLASVGVAQALPLPSGRELAAFPAVVPVLCKYGTPHCINKDPGGVRAPLYDPGPTLPDDGWVDPDCQFYPGLCDFPGELRGTTAPATGGVAGTTAQAKRK